MAVHRVHEFDTWRPGYGAAQVTVLIAGTSTPASLFSDEALTASIANPQTLSTQTANGVTAGKFATRVYTASAYTLSIDSIDQTGVERPALLDLVGVDAEKATVKIPGQSRENELEDIVARVVHAEDYGALDAADAATTTTTLAAAVSAASGDGGGEVLIPSGTWPFTQLSLPAGVVLRGAGRQATVLQSSTADKVITLAGNRAGLRRLTLDGVALNAGSVGVYAKAKNETVFDDAEVKRFETGIHFKGGRRAHWQDLFITNCATGAKLHGDDDAGGGADGDLFTYNAWDGGLVQQCTAIGIQLSYEDMRCIHNRITNVGFLDNTGATFGALHINGARFTTIEGCWFDGNTRNLVVNDDDNTTAAARLNNTVIGLFVAGGQMDAGTNRFSDACQSVHFDGVEFTGALIHDLNNPTNNILLTDCIEESTVTTSGNGNRLMRLTRMFDGGPSGVTTDATATKAWSMTLAPGQVVYAEGKALGNQRNGTNTAEYHISTSAKRPGSTLAYDTQTANFTVGSVLTGATSGATGRITADSDSGTTGTLTLRDIVGEFVDNEIISDAAGGSATANGTLAHQNVALLGSVTALRAAREDVAGWDATFAANGPELQLNVTGAASTTVEWTVDVQVRAT